MFVIGIIAAVLAAIAYGFSTVLRAMGARDATSGSDADAGSTSSTTATFTNKTFLVGTAMVVLGFAGGAVAARLLPLFLAQTIVAGNLVVTALLGTVVLGTSLTRATRIAIVVVVLSLLLLGMSASNESQNDPDRVFHWVLLTVTVVIAVIGTVAVRMLGQRGALLAGALAGAMYGAVAIGVRVLDGVAPFDVVRIITDPAAWTIAVGGAMAFYIQTIALQLGPVNAVTAVLVVGETGVPALVGVLFLGDQAIDGLEWLAYVGFAGAICGAAAVAMLTSSDPRPDPGPQTSTASASRSPSPDPTI